MTPQQISETRARGAELILDANSPRYHLDAALRMTKQAYDLLASTVDTWIRVEPGCEMPESSGHQFSISVLAMTVFGGVIAAYNRESQSWVYDNGHIVHVAITHWMPLPAPPKEAPDA